MQNYVALTSLSFLAVLALGCGTGSMASSSEAPDALPGAVLRGTVHGGRAPISGAHVYLFAANTTGYGGNGIAASSSNASVSLLYSNVGSSNIDNNGNYYVVSDSSGNWSIGGDCSCTSGQQVYVYSVGGNAGSGTNNGIGLLAALGACPVATNFATAYPFIVANEVTTIATAYAMAGFATDSTHVSSSGTSLALTGIGNAFANAANLVNVASGTANTTTPGGNGTVPQTTINTLANILAGCVNTQDVAEGSPITYSTNCTTLFNDETYNSIATTDTATAAIRMAQNPSTAITSLYGLSPGSPPFLPKLGGQFNDLTLSLGFTGAGLATPEAIAIDASGNAWVVGRYGVISGFSALGAPLSSAGFTSASTSSTSAIAIDASDNLWVASYTNNGILEMSTSGSTLGFYSNSPVNLGISSPDAIAIGHNGNIWVANGNRANLSAIDPSGSRFNANASGSGISSPTSLAMDGSFFIWVGNAASDISELTPSGGHVSSSSGYTGGGLGVPFAVAIDPSNNVWATTGSLAVELDNNGNPLSPSTGYTGGGLTDAYSLAIDGSGNVWFANNSASISELSPTGAALSPSTGFTAANFSGNSTYRNTLAIDGSGNLWVLGLSPDSLTEFIGLATPVVTPIVANLLSPYSAPASKP